ncbi:MAG TPA: hypothetical protein VFI22_05725, partial [Thermomicrobiales bacterium]|nr:hypothetical protein [Thermomicrobiales bacterium]
MRVPFRSRIPRWRPTNFGRAAGQRIQSSDETHDRRRKIGGDASVHEARRPLSDAHAEPPQHGDRQIGGREERHQRD